jgi:serine/threonine-protein kinase
MNDQFDRLKSALADRYRIESELGSGGMATVYLAEDLKHHRKVAVKVLRPELAAVLGAERFLKEIEVTANLQHPNILPLFDSGEADSFLYYVMPYVEGESLRDRLNREKQLPVDDALAITTGVAKALDNAHERGVIHRDIKPENILLRGGEALVSDFGIALAVSAVAGERLTDTGISVGTPEYMSPEQTTGERQLDARSDVYSLAVVLYEMLSGEPPHTGGTMQALMSKILTEEARPLRTTRPRIPVNVDDAVARALDRVPADRYPSARAFVTALETRDREWAHRAAGLRTVALTAALTAAVTGVVVVALVRSGSPPTPPLSTARVERPVTTTGDAWSVSLSPDGETVTYLTSQGLVVQDVSGGLPNLVMQWRLSEMFAGYAYGEPNGEPRWLPDGSGIAFGVVIDSTSFGINAVPRMGGAAVPRLIMGLPGGEPVAGFQALSDNETFLIARVLDPVSAAPWIRLVSATSEQGIDLEEDVIRLWDAIASPDGAWIAYIGEREDRTTVLGTVSADGERRNVIVEGGQELAKWGETSVSASWPLNRVLRWAATDRLYFRQLSGRGVDLHVVHIDLETGTALDEPRLILSGLPWGTSFDVSSDGTRLVYSGGSIRTQVRLFRFDTRTGGAPIEDRIVTRGTARHVTPRISPDAQRLAYVRKTRGSEDLYVMPLSGGEPERVSVLFEWRSISDLVWSPDGSRLAVHAETDGGPRLLIVSLSDSRVQDLETSARGVGSINWSPDGRFIARGVGDAGHYVLHELASKTDRRVFEDLNGELIHLLFSPDGTQILVNNIVPETIWAQSLQTGAPYLVTSKNPRSYPIHWSEDGTVYVLDPTGAILTVPSTGGTLEKFAEVPVQCIWEGWASMGPHAEYFACSWDERRESDVWVIDNFDPGIEARR